MLPAPLRGHASHATLGARLARTAWAAHVGGPKSCPKPGCRNSKSGAALWPKPGCRNSTTGTASPQICRQLKFATVTYFQDKQLGPAVLVPVLDTVWTLKMLVPRFWASQLETVLNSECFLHISYPLSSISQMAYHSRPIASTTESSPAIHLVLLTGASSFI